MCWLAISFPSCGTILTTPTPVARAPMWLTPSVIKTLPFQACQLFFLKAAWGDPLTMIHGSKLRTICSLGESQPRWRGRGAAVFFFPLNSIQVHPTNHKFPGITLNVAHIISICSCFSGLFLQSPSHWMLFLFSLHYVKCQFSSLYKLSNIHLSLTVQSYLSISILLESTSTMNKTSRFGWISPS